MSVSAAVQKLIFETLVANAKVRELCEDRIYDRVPKSAVFPYVSFGSSDFSDDEVDCIPGGELTVQIDVWSRAVGKVECKKLADAVRRALHRCEGDLEEGALVEMRVRLVQVFPDPDGLTTHGVIQIGAMVEDPQ